MKDYIETQYKNLDFTIPDDYVSRREVYAMLDYIGGADADEAFYQGWDAAIDEACSLLNDVDSAIGWTSVEEEPPEESGTLLVTRCNKLTGFREVCVAQYWAVDKRFVVMRAGDANVEKGYIGEYATKWNKRACNDEDAMHEIKQTLLGTIYPLEQTVELLEQRNKELEQENQKLKQMLKKVADDAEGLFMGFAGYNPYEKRLKHEDCEAREYCDYCDRDCDCDGQCKWRYEDDVKKLLGLE